LSLKEKEVKDRIVYLSEDAPLGSFSVSLETIRERENFISGAEGDDEGAIVIRTRHPKEDGILCAEKQTETCPAIASHTMATQLLNADADLATIQDLLGHGQITTTQRYCWVAKPQSPTRLLQGDGGGPAKNTGTRRGCGRNGNRGSRRN